MAGAGYGTLVVYLVLVIQQGMNIPILSSDSEVTDPSGALSTEKLRFLQLKKMQKEQMLI